MSGETEKDISGWTVDTLHQLMNVGFSERDIRYEQRFQSQQHAVELALSGVDKEFHEHLRQYAQETKAALDAADKAILKSELATEKRFENVNEFRAQLADQARNFMPRQEALTLASANAEKIDALATRIDRTEGRGTGVTAAWGFLVAAIGLAATVVAVVVAVTR